MGKHGHGTGTATEGEMGKHGHGTGTGTEGEHKSMMQKVKDAVSGNK